MGRGIVPLGDKGRAPSATARAMRALVAVPFLLAGCSISMPCESCWSTDDAMVDGATAVRESKLEVTEGMGMVLVALDANATAGEGTWMLVDPDGNTRWRCHMAAAQQLQQQCSFANEPGTWTVRRQWQDFTGTQHFCVHAASAEKLQIKISLGK